LEQEDKTQRREGRTPEKGGTRGERKRRERGERDRIKQKGKRGNLALTDRPDQASKIFIELFSTLNQAQPPTFLKTSAITLNCLRYWIPDNFPRRKYVKRPDCIDSPANEMVEGGLYVTPFGSGYFKKQ
jgi:hypothetical protein